MSHASQIRRAVLIAAVVMAASAAAIAWWRRSEARSAVVARSIPAQPELDGWPPELRERVTRATASAHAGHIAALGELSVLYHANGFLEAASAAYHALETLEPNEPRWWHRHAVILAGYGELETARNHAARAVTLAPEYAPARVRLADVLLKQNRFEEAAAAYKQVCQQGTYPHALLGLARIDVERGRWTDARTKLERVVAQTNFNLGYDLIVTVYEKLGLGAEAAKVRGRTKASGAYREMADPWVDELIDFCFDAYRLSLAAGASQRTGDGSTALRRLRRAVALAPDDVSVRFQLAQTLVEQIDLTAALRELQQCTVAAPSFADAWAHLAALRDRADDRNAAERVVTEGLIHNPESPGLHLMRARFHRQAGRTSAAAESYRRSLQLRPNEAEPYVELATLLLQNGGTSEALASLHQAVEVEPDFPDAISLLTLTAIATHDEATARRWLEQVQAQPRMPAAQVVKLLAAYRAQFGREFQAR